VADRTNVPESRDSRTPVAKGSEFSWVIPPFVCEPFGTLAPSLDRCSDFFRQPPLTIVRGGCMGSPKVPVATRVRFSQSCPLGEPEVPEGTMQKVLAVPVRRCTVFMLFDVSRPKRAFAAFPPPNFSVPQVGVDVRRGGNCGTLLRAFRTLGPAFSLSPVVVLRAVHSSQLKANSDVKVRVYHVVRLAPKAGTTVGVFPTVNSCGATGAQVSGKYAEMRSWPVNVTLKAAFLTEMERRPPFAVEGILLAAIPGNHRKAVQPPGTLVRA